MKPKPIKPQPGQESVWDYPRPPRLESVDVRIHVVFNNKIIADTRRAMRVLETSHPPNYYIPPEDVVADCLTGVAVPSLCEWKGAATYYSVVVGERRAEKAAWSYPQPTASFAAIRDYLGFYAWAMDACYVDGEQVVAQPGYFYGGWITRNIVGPFKGERGTWGW